MKKEITLLSAIFVLNLPALFFSGEEGAINCYAQFPFNVGAASNDASNEITLDGSSNAYVTGYFQGTADFDPGVGIVNLTSSGGFEIYVVKYNSSGYYQWAFSIGSASNDIGYDITTDGSSNVYVTGYFQGTADFDPGVGTANLTATGTQDIFVAKYNSAGAYQWAFNVGAASNDVGYGIFVDGSSNVYVTGYFQGTADFDPGAGTANLTATGTQDIFVVKYNSAGAYQWAFNVGAASNDVGYGIFVDGSSNVYVTGYFQGTADFDPGAGTASLTAAGTQDIFVAKYNPAGVYQWAFSVGAGSNDSGTGIALDGSSNVYVIGSFQGTADFNPGAGTDNLITVGVSDIFVAKYNSSGTYQWAFSVGSVSFDYCYGIALDGNSNSYVTGNFQGTADFDPGAGTANLTPVGTTDIYVAKYNSAGVYQCAFNVGSAIGDVGLGIAADGNSNAYVTGYFQGSADFDPGASTVNLTPAGGQDIFVAKYDIACNIVVLPVEILSFSSSFEKMYVKLQWQTASEQNNDYFTIERSKDGSSFEQIDTVQGVGNSTTTHNYEFIDSSPPDGGGGQEGALYYRLKQTDFDGRHEYFGPVSVRFTAEKENCLLVFPNPATIDEINIAATGEENQKVKLEIHSMQGALVYCEEINLDSNQLPQKILLNEKTGSGFYIITAQTGTTICRQKLIIQ